MTDLAKQAIILNDQIGSPYTQAVTRLAKDMANEIKRLRKALHVIAGRQQQVDYLISNVDIALEALADDETKQSQVVDPCDTCGAVEHNLRANKAEARAMRLGIIAEEAYWLLAWTHQHLFTKDPRIRVAGLAVLDKHRDHLNEGEGKLLDTLIRAFGKQPDEL